MMRRKRRGMMPEAKFLSDLPEHERHDPGDTYLKAQAVKYERENHPKTIARCVTLASWTYTPA